MAPGCCCWLAAGDLAAGRGIALILLALAMSGDDLAKSDSARGPAAGGHRLRFGCWKCAMPLRELKSALAVYALLVNWVGDMGAIMWAGAGARHRWRRGSAEQIVGRGGGVGGGVRSGCGAYLWHFVPGVGGGAGGVTHGGRQPPRDSLAT